MSDERPEPLGPKHPLMHYQAGTIEAMLGAMCKEDKAMVLEYLGLSEVEEAPPPEGRKMGGTDLSETLSKKKQ